MSDIIATAEKITAEARTKRDPSTRTINSEDQLPYGKVIRQGDLYIRRHPVEDFEKFETDGEQKTAQLVNGNTIGSRHETRMDRGEKVYNRKNASPLQGPIVMAKNGFYLGHPKHADMDVQLPGCYEVTYPIDEAARERDEIRRRRD